MKSQGLIMYLYSLCTLTEYVCLHTLYSLFVLKIRQEGICPITIGNWLMQQIVAQCITQLKVFYEEEIL